jgi:hypothetical protein
MGSSRPPEDVKGFMQVAQREAVESRAATLEARRNQHALIDNDWAQVPFAACEMLYRQRYPKEVKKPTRKRGSSSSRRRPRSRAQENSSQQQRTDEDPTIPSEPQSPTSQVSGRRGTAAFDEPVSEIASEVQSTYEVPEKSSRRRKEEKPTKVVDPMFADKINREHRMMIRVPKSARTPGAVEDGWAPTGPTHLMAKLYEKRRVLPGVPRSERFARGGGTLASQITRKDDTAKRSSMIDEDAGSVMPASDFGGSSAKRSSRPSTTAKGKTFEPPRR